MFAKKTTSIRQIPCGTSRLRTERYEIAEEWVKAILVDFILFGTG